MLGHKADLIRFCGWCKGDKLITPARRKWCQECNPLDITRQQHFAFVRFADIVAGQALATGDLRIQERYSPGRERYYRTVGLHPYVPATGLSVEHLTRDLALELWKKKWLTAYLAGHLNPQAGPIDTVGMLSADIEAAIADSCARMF